MYVEYVKVMQVDICALSKKDISLGDFWMDLLPCCVPRDVNSNHHQIFEAFLVGEDF